MMYLVLKLSITLKSFVPLDLVLALGFLAQGLPVTKPSKVPWRQLFRKASVW